MEYFGGDRDEYLRYLERGTEKDSYIDPDKTYGDVHSAFYNDLVDFLTIIETEKKMDNRWSYVYSGYVKGNEQPAGIWVRDANSLKAVLYLRSDQFGFSAPSGKKRVRAWDESHPYGLFMRLRGEKSFVADCIRDTRTLGGSFLWPLFHGGRNWYSKYNCQRGVNAYIEDRVDLTLYEIKCFYDLIEENPDMDDQTICEQLKKKGCLLLRYVDKLEICTWLKHFKTFKEYVDAFCFQPFVDDKYQIIDITKAELAWDEKEKMKYGFNTDIHVLSPEEVDSFRESKRIASMKDSKSLRQVLLNVRLMTVKRTYKIEEMVHKYRNHKAGA